MVASYKAVFIFEDPTNGAVMLGSRDLAASDGIQAAIDEAIQQVKGDLGRCTAIDILADGRLVERVGVGDRAART